MTAPIAKSSTGDASSTPSETSAEPSSAASTTEASVMWYQARNAMQTAAIATHATKFPMNVDFFKDASLTDGRGMLFSLSR